jgi:hypothetical protein
VRTAKKKAQPKGKSVYSVVGGAHFTEKDAAIIGPEIERLSGEALGKKVTPETVLDAARAKSSPIHTYFEWNNSKAAEQYRLEQARRMIRSISIQWVEPVKGKAVTTRAFQVIRGGQGGPGYVPIQVIQSDEEMMAELVERAQGEARSWHQRYQKLREVASLAPLFEAIEKAGIVGDADDEPAAAE